MMKNKTESRLVSDSLGEITLPPNVLYAAQTQRAIENFPISGRRMPQNFIQALVLIKKAAATANIQLEQIPPNFGHAIVKACDILLKHPRLMEHFPVDIFQTGSGTSSNMNANEVLASLASDILNEPIDPNDHVNCSQSSNDVIPTAIHVSCAIALHSDLIPALNYLSSAICKKAKQVGHFVKTGRTHLMDAMPIRFDQCMSGWANQIDNNVVHLKTLQNSLQELCQGGTAVGTGVNAPAEFAIQFIENISNLTDLNFKSAPNFFSQMGSQDVAVSVSGGLKTTAVSLMKISNDLRWMNSGPLSGLGEIELEPLQPGSSIMPGKVNPVIPEAATMVSAQVIGNDSTITIAGQSGNFELNVMLPLIASNLLDSIQLLTNVSHLLADKAVTSFSVNQEKIEETLARNPILVTALNPIIGYAKSAEIAKQAYRENRPIIEVASENTDLSQDELNKLLNPKSLT
mgnify:FL=1